MGRKRERLGLGKAAVQAHVVVQEPIPGSFTTTGFSPQQPEQLYHSSQFGNTTDPLYYDLNLNIDYGMWFAKSEVYDYMGSGVENTGMVFDSFDATCGFDAATSFEAASSFDAASAFEAASSFDGSTSPFDESASPFDKATTDAFIDQWDSV